jgi:SOS-response transcriptional repressor LexA|tara:strand:- start:189 stop:1019 length:831 start_codon:yes stop_codon:yes gene_type:complete
MSGRREPSAIEREEAERLNAIFAKRKAQALERGERLSQESVGHAIGSNQGVVSQYLLGLRPISVDTMLRFAEVLQFQLYEVSPRLANRLAKLTRSGDEIKGYAFPILTQEQVLKRDAGANDEAHTEWEHTTTPASDSAFWLEVPDNSMASLTGPGFNAGMLILVDPDVGACNGDLVVAANQELQQVLFRRVALEDGSIKLKAINDIFPTTDMAASWRTAGKVLKAVWSESRVVELELSRSVIAEFQKGGGDWQGRMNAALKHQLQVRGEAVGHAHN